MTPRSPHAADTVEVAEAARLVADGVVILLDVREPGEWQAGRSPDAYHVPLGALGALDPDLLPTHQAVIVVCRSGIRSAKATSILRAVGVPARNLAGGMRAWAAAGLPVTAEDGQPGTVI